MRFTAGDPVTRQWATIAALTRAASGDTGAEYATACFLAKFDRYPNPRAALRAHMRRLRVRQMVAAPPRATPAPAPVRAPKYQLDRRGFRVLGSAMPAEGAA